MKKRTTTCLSLVCLLFLFCVNTTFSQQFSKVDALVENYPKSYSSPKKLAEQINTDFNTDEDKARAIFTWIALNIRYDLKAYKDGASMVAFSYKDEQDKQAKLQKFRIEYADKTLRTKKGVCQDYSALFHTVCDLTNLKCIDIIGTSKAHPAHIGKLPKAEDHEWNAVKIGNDWKLIDVTWASGSVSAETGKFMSEFNDAYFFTAPEVFFLNHFPNDKRMLMINKSEQEFAALPLYYGTYIQADYEIVAPEKGIFSASKTNVIPFQIIGFPKNSKIGYVFTNEGKLRDIEPKRNGNASEFEIAITGRSRGFLTVYVDNAAVATYKIER